MSSGKPPEFFAGLCWGLHGEKYPEQGGSRENAQDSHGLHRETLEWWVCGEKSQLPPFGMAPRTWTGLCCVLGTDLELRHVEKAFGVRDVEKAGQCHCGTSLKALGKARAIPEGPGHSGRADTEPVCKQGREGTGRVPDWSGSAGKGMWQILLQPLQALAGQGRDCRAPVGGKRRACCVPRL